MELQRKEALTINNFYAGCYQNYTDGFWPVAVGVDPSRKGKHLLIHRQELYAIIESLSYLHSCDGTNVVLSHSKGALLYLALYTSGKRGLTVAYFILDVFLEVQLRNKMIKFQWILENKLNESARSGIYNGIGRYHRCEEPFTFSHRSFRNVNMLNKVKEIFW